MKIAKVAFLAAFLFLEGLAILSVYNLRAAMLVAGLVCALGYLAFRMADFAVRKAVAFGKSGAAGIGGLLAYRLMRRLAGGGFQPVRPEFTDPQIARFMASGLTRDEAESALRNLWAN